MIFNRRTLEGKIMIVDDNQINVSLLEKLLRTADFTSIKSTTDPREAKNIYRDFQPDILLLDLDMPHLDGFQVMEQLKEIEREAFLPVLVITGRNDNATCVRALEAGALDFIVKPFEPVEAINRIRNMLQVRLMHKQVRDQNRLLEDKVRERTKELHETRLDVIHHLGRAAEYRDNETGMHIIRMGKAAYLLGKAMRWDDDQCELLLQASPMHDIGKIGIPDKILLKPGKLAHEEWEIMKTHTTIGAELLSGHSSDLMVMARSIALTHHEKWDGSGYPNGLKGEDIPMEGRICAISDVFDALTSDRPYKKAWSIEDAIAEVYRGAGKHFDPNLIAQFKIILPEILAIKEQFADIPVSK